jgi:uncharacterized protein (DUF1015 family)
MRRMDDTRDDAARIVLHGFRALWLRESLVGAPFANRVFARPYRSIPGRLLDWRRKRHLRVDPEPGFYVHEYTAAGGVSVRGVVANLELDPAAPLVLPHEGVHPGQVSQLARRMRFMQLNPAPILLVHRESAALRPVVDGVASGPPDRSFMDGADQYHRIWRIADAQVQRSICEALADASLVIADGHHRYAAARELHSEEPDTGWDRTLVMLVDARDSPLQLGAIHRSVKGVDLDVVEAVARERGDEFVRHPGRSEALAHLHGHLVLGAGDQWATLRPAGAEGLLVTTLHEALLPAWGVDEEQVSHHHAAGEALAEAESGLAILLPAPTFEQVATAAEAGELLPHKATSFQPKPHLGALMRDLRDE